MKAIHFWRLTCVRISIILASTWVTSSGSVLQGKPIGLAQSAALFGVCSAFVLLSPCYRKLDQRFLVKHGTDIVLFLRYGYLGVFHGTSRWILFAIVLGKLLAVGDRGWWILMQIPALLLLGFATYSGYPGLESYGLTMRIKSASALKRRLRCIEE